MVYQLTSNDFRQLVTRTIPQAQLGELYPCDTVQIMHTAKIGSFQMMQTYLPDSTMADVQADFANTIRLQGITDPSHVSLHFHLNGYSQARIAGFPKPTPFSGGFHNLFYCHQPSGNFELPQQQGFKYFVISLTPEFISNRITSSEELLGTLMNKIVKGESYLASRNHLPILPQMMQAIHNIRHCHFSRAVKQLFLESKVLELLALQLQHCEEATKSKQLKVLASKEKAIFYDIKSYLDTHYLQTHSLSSIARTFGINEFALKKGFKGLFGYTVFGYLLELRLQYARHLLQETKQTLDEVAIHAGYSCAAHFSHAYKKRFTISPGKYRKEV